MGTLDGKIALITGSGSGIGAASAQALAQEGAQIVLIGRRRASLETIAQDIQKAGGQAHIHALDVTHSQAVIAMVEEVQTQIGTIDIVVHNAGSAGIIRNPQFLTEAEWNSVLQTNLTAVFTLTKAVLDGMLAREDGTIITISSLAAVNANLLGGAAYGAAKAGVKNFMQFLHNSYRNQGLRAMTILPGETDTPIMDTRARKPESHERAQMLQAQDVARAVLLCATLDKRAVIPELHICPTYARDISADLDIARHLEHFPKSVQRFSDKKCGENKKLEHFTKLNEAKNALDATTQGEKI